MSELIPRVVVSVMVMKEGKVLMNFRKGGFASEMFGLPGGKLDNGETFQQCAERETMEESGVVIGPGRFLCVLNNHAHTPMHFINFGFIADWVSGEPQVLEPEKCASWGWYDLDHLPEPMTEVNHAVLQAYRTGEQLFDNSDL